MDWFDTAGDGWLETAFGDLNADGYFDVVHTDPTADGLINDYYLDTEFNGVHDFLSPDTAPDPVWSVDPLLGSDTSWEATVLGGAPDTDPTAGGSFTDGGDDLTDIFGGGSDPSLESSAIWTLPSPW